MKTPKNMIRLVILGIMLFVIEPIHAQMNEASPKETLAVDVMKKKPEFNWFPIVFWTPETKFLGGMILNYSIPRKVHGLDAHPTEITLPFIYTQEKQVISALEADHYWNDETSRVRLSAEFVRFFEEYYGIGNASEKSAKEEYTPQNLSIQVTYFKKIYSRLYLGPKYEFSKYRIVTAEKNGRIAQLPNGGSSLVSGAGAEGYWDTRNNEIYPRSGSFHQFSVVSFSEWTGSDKTFTRTVLDFRRYFKVTRTHVLAVQAYGSFIEGHAPIHKLALFGGQNVMRGYYAGRYRDQHMAAVQAEYRMPLVWRFGLTAFGGWGDVAHRIADFNAKDLKYSTGVGIRFAIDKKNNRNIRFDIAFGKHSAQPAIGIGEAF